MRSSFYLLLILVVSFLLAACVGEPSLPSPTPTPTLSAPVQPLRLFLLRSYGMKDLSSNRMRAGILSSLAQGGYDVSRATLELEELALDVEPSLSKSFPEQVNVAVGAIREFGPDLVVVLDDEAARTVIPLYPDTTLPFVFCGLAGIPHEYDLVRPNVTGVLEHPYPVETIRMAQRFTAQRDLLILGDESLPATTGATAIAAELAADEGLNLRRVVTCETNDWEEWQLLVLDEAAGMDFILLLKYQTLENDWGGQISEQSVINWTLKNSPIPVFGLWLQTVSTGAVGGLTISTYVQGELAGEMVLEIAAGRSPDEIPATRPINNILAVNAVAAEYWNLKIPLEFVVTARIERQFPVPVGGW